MKKFQTRYGYFTEDGREYVITDYQTPRPWVNVISNGHYGLVVSQVNGGFSWLDNSNLNRLTRWNQDLISDNQGRFIFLRDEQSGEFWSPTVQPLLTRVSDYECRHGLGYTVIQSTHKNIHCQLRIFVPFEANLEIWTITITNQSNEDRVIGLYTYLEWCLGAAPDNHREFHKTFLETRVDEQAGVQFARKRLWEVPTDKGHWNTDWPWVAYFAGSEAVDGFEGDKEAFLGRNRSLHNALALETGQLTNKQTRWNDSIAAVKKVLPLAPGEERVIHCFLGAEDTEDQIRKRLQFFRQNGQVEEAFSATRHKWQELFEHNEVQTPDEALNIMTNHWLKYQAISSRIWARTAYYQQSGAYGFRDQLQDSQIFLYMQPELTKKQLLLHAAHQFEDGRVLHWWHTMTDIGLDAGMSDDLLWMPFVLIQYLKETADWDILHEKVKFYESSQTDRLLDHCLRAIDLALNRFSDRGLPLILTGDWNDGLSAVGLKERGESIWLAHFLYYLLVEILPVLQRTGLTEKKTDYANRAEQLFQAINQHGWDGDWFWRATKDNGERIGSHQNEQGKIFLNAQTWSVIAGSTDQNRQRKALDSAIRHLESKVGALLLAPAYQNPDPDIGYLSRYAPGLRENGGVYTHAATWMIWAAAKLNDPDSAYRFYRKINPIQNSLNPDDYYAEPYVTPGNIDGPDSPHYGRAGWTWYTGSAAWLFRVTMDHLLGIQADYEGLRIAPCFPKEWPEVNVKRQFRGIVYHIKIVNQPLSEVKKPLQIFVDGKPIDGSLIPVCQKNKRIEVLVQRGI